MKTTITVSSDFANELNQLKYQYGFLTIEQLLKHYILKSKKNGGKQK